MAVTSDTIPCCENQSKVRVVARIRPSLAKESKAAKGKPKSYSLTVTRGSERGEIYDTLHIKDLKENRSECYKLDLCYSEEDEVAQIFTTQVVPILPGLFRGSNATVLAYGATGSGKTYTMQGTHHKPGLVPLAITELVSMATSCNKAIIEISYCQIYMDRCYDLLQRKNKPVPIPVLEDSEGRVQLPGLVKVRVSSLQEFQETLFRFGVMSKGSDHVSSHSGSSGGPSTGHGVLMIWVTCGNVVGRLNLIDLGGNQDSARGSGSGNGNGNEGALGLKEKESTRIDKSLFALSNVIHALNANTSRVPYRDNKLSRILQDSLGGRGTNFALVIACLNPTASYLEAIHTVRLASRLGHIVNHVDADVTRHTGTQKGNGSSKHKVDMDAELMNSRPDVKRRKIINGNAGIDRASIITQTQAMVRSVCPRLPSRQIRSRYLSVKRSISLNGTDTLTGNGNIIKSALKRHGRPGGRGRNAKVTIKLPSTHNSPKENPKNGSDIDITKQISTLSIFKRDDQQKQELTAPSTSPREEASISKSSCIVSEFKFTSMPGEDDAIVGQSRTPSQSDRCVTSPRALPLSTQLKKLESTFTEITTPKTTNLSYPLAPLSAQLKNLESAFSEMSTSKATNVSFPFNPSGTSSARSFLRTPRTPYEMDEDVEDTGEASKTPLQKFSARSSGIKLRLAEEYLNFLNTASREELLEVKGIGEKRADDIIRLREMHPCPLNELSDLKKIGLTSKQIRNMFLDTATDIFD